MTVDIASLAIKVDSTGVKSGTQSLTAFEKAAKDAAGSASAFSKATDFATSRAGLFAAATVAAGAAMTAAAGKTIAYQDALLKVSTIADAAAFNMSALSDAALDQSLAFGKLPVDQVGALYDLISSGAKNSANAIDLLTASNNLAIGGITSVGVATNALTSVLNAYGTKAGTATDISDAMFVAMRDGKVTIGQLGAELGTVTPIAAAMGVSFDQLNAAVAALTAGGIGVSESMTGVRAILSTVASPTQEAADMAAQLGLQFNAAALQAKGFSGFLQDVFTKSNRNTEALAKLFGGVEALVPVMALAGDTGAVFNAVLDNMSKKSGATQSAVDKMSQSTQFQLDRMGAALDVLAIKATGDIERGLLPSLTSAADGLAYVAKNADLSEIASLAAAAASGRLATSMIAVARAQMEIGVTARLATTATRALSGTMAFFGGPIGLAITALSVGITALAFSQSEAEKAAEKHSVAMDAFNAALKEGSKNAGEMDAKLRAIAKARLEDALAAKQQALASSGGDIGTSGTFGLAGQAIKYGAEAASAVYDAGVAYKQLVAAGDTSALDTYVKRLEEIKTLSPDAAEAVNAEFEKVGAVIQLRKDIDELNASMSKLDEGATAGGDAVKKIDVASGKAGSGGVQALTKSIADLKTQLTALQTGGKEALALVQDRIAAEAALKEVSGQGNIDAVTKQVTEQRRLQDALKAAQQAYENQGKSRNEIEAELTDAIKKASDVRIDAAAKEIEARKAADDALKQSVELEKQALEQREGTADAVKKAVSEQTKAEKELADKKKQLRADERTATQEALDRFADAAKVRQDAEKSLADAVAEYNRSIRDSKKDLLQADKDYAAAVKQINDDLVQAERDYADEVARIRDARLGVTDDNETRLRELRRRAMSDYEREADIAAESADRILRAQNLLSQGQSSAAQKEAERAATLAGQLDDVQQAISLTEQATSVIEDAADATARADQAQAALDLQEQQASAVERELDAVVALSEARATAAEQEQQALEALTEARQSYADAQVNAAVIEANAIITLAAQREALSARQQEIMAAEAERDQASIEAKTQINDAIKEGMTALTDGDAARAKASAEAIDAASKQLTSEQELSAAVKASRDIIAAALDAEAVKAREVYDQQIKVSEQYASHEEAIKRLEDALAQLSSDYVKSADAANTAASDTVVYFRSAFENVDNAQRTMAAQAISRYADMAAAAERAGNRIDAALSAYSSADSQVLKVLGFASGGIVSNDNIPGFASGGILQGPGTGTSDSILGVVDGRKPVRLSNGEGIVNKAAVDYYGAESIHRINRLQAPKFADGGVIGGAAASPSGGSATYNITIQVNGQVDPDKLLVQINEAAKRASARGR
jgi:hypothetical protein